MARSLERQEGAGPIQQELPIKSSTVEKREDLSEKLVLVTGQSNPSLAQEIADLLGLELQQAISKRFADGEPHVKIPRNLRNRNVVIIQSTSRPQGENFMDLVLMGDAARRAAGENITAVIPYPGYSRQDKKDQPREPISTSATGRILELFFDRIITVDIHSRQTQGAILGPWDDLSSMKVFQPQLELWGTDNLVFVSPDASGTRRVDHYTDVVPGSTAAWIHKRRDPTTENASKTLNVIGEVEGKDCVIVDDMFDTAGSLYGGAIALAKSGARSIKAIAPHGLFSGEALDRISASPIEEVLVTDTIQQPQAVLDHPKIRVLTVAPLLMEAIYSNEIGDSLSAQGLFS